MIAAAKVASEPDGSHESSSPRCKNIRMQHGPFAPFNVPEVATAYRSQPAGLHLAPALAAGCFNPEPGGM